MSREEFLDAPPAALGEELTPAGVPRVRRPLNGGWTLMIAAGLIAAVTNYALLTMDDATVAVAVLDADAPAGTPLEQLDIRMADMVIEDPHAHRLADDAALEALAGQVTATRLEAGVLLRTSDLRVPSGEGLAAMSLPIDTARAVGGLLQAGDRVDVIAGADEAADYVVRDVQVIEVSAASAGLGGVSGAYAVTLSVDGAQALQLARALRAGDLDIVRTEGGTG